MITIATHSLINCNQMHKRWSENSISYISTAIIQITGMGIGVGLYFAGAGLVPALCTSLSLFIAAEAILIAFLKFRKNHDSAQRFNIKTREEIEAMVPHQIGEDAMQIIFEQLNVQELGIISQTCKHAWLHGNSALLERAKKFGYKGDDVTEAKWHLEGLFSAVKVLVREGCLVEKQVVFYDTFLGRKVSAEETLQLLLDMSETEKYYLKFQLEKALCNYVLKRNHQMVYALIALGADPNCKQNQPLFNAVEKGDKQMTKILLKGGANPNCMNAQGLTPLCLNTSDPKLTQLLLDFGAKADYRLPLNNKTALDYARLRKHTKSLEILNNHLNK